MSDEQLDFQTAAELAITGFGPENRVIYGVEVRMTERLPDRTTRVRTARWGEAAGQGRVRHENGVDGHGLLVLAWCSCGYNRTAATRATARRKLDTHVRLFEEMDRRLDARVAANFAAFHASAEEPS